MNDQRRRSMLISPLWLQVSVLTFLFGFAVLGFLTAYLYAKRPPVPERVLASDGRVLFTRRDIMTGQHLFEKYGLMQFGTIFGHGAYLGPDFTAEYLHRSALDAIDRYQAEGDPRPVYASETRSAARSLPQDTPRQRI